MGTSFMGGCSLLLIVFYVWFLGCFLCLGGLSDVRVILEQGPYKKGLVKQVQQIGKVVVKVKG